MDKIRILYERICRHLPDLELRLNEPMSRHTSFRVGGPAAVMALPATEKQLISVVNLARSENVDPIFVGAGSNILVADNGLAGLVVKIAPQMNEITADGCRITASAGVLLSQIALLAASKGLTGLEFAHGIPGSLGGAVTMDAGAYGGEMRQVVRSVRALNNAGEVEELSEPECEFGYRHSVFSDGSRLVLSACMELAPGDEKAIRGRMAELMTARREKQPLEYPSAGSTFKRPEGYFAAALIDQCGLKGLTVGGAQVSPKHAGFVINIGDATCSDILKLMDEVKERVFRETGVELEPEVKYLH